MTYKYHRGTRYTYRNTSKSLFFNIYLHYLVFIHLRFLNMYTYLSFLDGQGSELSAVRVHQERSKTGLKHSICTQWS